MTMSISSRTWDGGEPRNRPVCRQTFWVEPSVTAGEAPCPSCGHLLWPLDRVWVAPELRVATRATRLGRHVRTIAGAVRSAARRVQGAMIRKSPKRNPKPEPVATPAPSAGVWDAWLDA